jgi:uncharacterized membrane protein (Fun14 family)
MKKLVKILLVISITIIFISLVFNAPKGTDYVKWERMMVKTGQLK